MNGTPDLQIKKLLHKFASEKDFNRISKSILENELLDSLKPLLSKMSQEDLRNMINMYEPMVNFFIIMELYVLDLPLKE